VAHINSHETPLWGAGVSHEHEMEYGSWLQDEWERLGRHAWSLLTAPEPLLLQHPRLGRGFLVTLHERGLMAVWEEPGQPGVSTPVVRIDTSRTESSLVHRFRSIPGDESGETRLTIPDTTATQAELLMPNGAREVFAIADRLRRHTLGAGDTVRGCLAYGLWGLAFRVTGHPRRPRDVARVLHAATVLATVKCWAGTFVEFLRVVDGLREQDALWSQLWGFPEGD
jgi:hypothetical protein